MINYKDTNELSFEHRICRFNLFETDVSKPTIFSTDPWGVIRGYINEKICECKKSSASKTKLTEALYHIKQAEQLYKVAQSTPLLTKNIILYYSIMHAAKCLNKVNGRHSGDHHGLTVQYQSSNKYELKIIKKNESSSHSEMTFENFCNVLCCNFGTDVTFSFENLVEHLVEVHNLNSALKATTRNTHLNYLPVHITLREFTSREKKMYALFFKIKASDLNIYGKNKINKYLVKNFNLNRVSSTDDLVVYKDLNKEIEYRNLSKQIKTRSKKIRQLGNINSIIGPSGVRHYIYLGERKYNHLSYIYLTMFLLGHIARYNPLVAEQFLSGKKYALISEITNLCPDQFIYQLANLIVGSELLPDKFKVS